MVRVLPKQGERRQSAAGGGKREEKRLKANKKIICEADTFNR